MALDETTFEKIADDFLGKLMDAIDDDLGDQMDVDLQGGILTIDLDAGGQYVINKHGPNQQIWMSSPKSGATHYGRDESAGTWLCTRSGADMLKTLASELSAVSGKSVDFHR